MRIPSKEDYIQFLNNFSEKLSHELPDACFYVYGSINSENCNYGRSDIDGGIILNSGIVTPKDKIEDLSKVLSDSLSDSGIKTQFNLLDLESCRDGRFLSYSEDYTSWIKKSSKVYSGPNLLGELNGKDYKSGVLYSAAFNFCGPGGVRDTLLYSTVYKRQNKEDFRIKASNTLEKVAKFPKKLLWLRGEEIIQSREIARKRLTEILEDVDLTPLDEINYLLSNPLELYSQLENDARLAELLNSSLDCMENMILSNIRHFPETNSREIK